MDKFVTSFWKVVVPVTVVLFWVIFFAYKVSGDLYMLRIIREYSFVIRQVSGMCFYILIDVIIAEVIIALLTIKRAGEIFLPKLFEWFEVEE